MDKNKDEEFVELSRQELYEKVWSTPVQILSKLFVIREYDIAKICAKHLVPRPPPGYWQKIRHGYHISQPPLPKINEEHLNHIVITRQKSTDQLRESKKNKKSRVAPVPSPKTSFHPLVKQTRKQLQFCDMDRFGRVVATKGSLDLLVGTESLERALHLIDVVVKTIELNKHTVSVSFHADRNNTKWITLARVFEEEVQFHIEESLSKTSRILGHERFKRNQYSNLLSGKLSLVIDSYIGDGLQKTWSDGAQGVLENKIDSFVNGLVQASASLRDLREKREALKKEIEAAESKRREADRLRKEKEDQLRNLEGHIRSWEKAQSVRCFVKAFEEAVRNKFGEANSDTKFNLWINTALDYANSLDPIYLTFNQNEPEK